jgi:hypothetical protein
MTVSTWTRHFSCIRRACAAGAILLGMSASGVAGIITYTGSDMDLGGGWRTSTLSKFDIDNNNVLGSDGWFVAGGAGSTQLPAYLQSLVNPGNSIYPGNGGYASIDDPNSTPGLTPTTLVSGTMNPFVSEPHADLILTFGGSVPTTVRLGLMVDNLDIAGYNPSALQVVQSGGPGSSAVVDTTLAQSNNRIPDWFYFDIQAQPGDSYNVLVSSGPNGCNCLGAVSFDSVATPEPMPFELMGIGAAVFSVLALRRRRLMQSKVTATIS